MRNFRKSNKLQVQYSVEKIWTIYIVWKFNFNSIWNGILSNLVKPNTLKDQYIYVQLAPLKNGNQVPLEMERVDLQRTWMVTGSVAIENPDDTFVAVQM